MQLTLGTNIRLLRRRSGQTQEALAAVLGVTPQAVSRWEAGGSCPDVALLPVIANHFCVTLDELFGCASDRAVQAEALAANIRDMIRENNGVDHSLDACIAEAREALLRFPGNAPLTLCLASALYTAGYVRRGEKHLTDADGYDVYDVAAHKQYPEWREAIPLYEWALPMLPDGALRDRATEELTQLYVNTGACDKAQALADTAPSLWSSRTFLRIGACDGKARAREIGRALLEMLHASAILIAQGVMTGDKQLTPAEKADALKGAADLFVPVSDASGCGLYAGLIARIHMFRAMYLWLDGRQDEAFASLDTALETYQSYVKVLRAQRETFAAPLVRLAGDKLSADALPHASDPSWTAACLPEDFPWWDVPEAQEVKAAMQQDPRWAAWAVRTRETLG